MTESDLVDAGAALRQVLGNLISRAGLSELGAIARLTEELERIEREAVAAARKEGATWQEIADELHRASRQWAQGKFDQEVPASLPGMSAAAMARRLGIHQQTVAASPERHGVIVRTFSGIAGGRPRKRYFLPGDEGSVAPQG